MAERLWQRADRDAFAEDAAIAKAVVEAKKARNEAEDKKKAESKQKTPAKKKAVEKKTEPKKKAAAKKAEPKKKAMVKKWRSWTRFKRRPAAIATVKLSMARARAVSHISRVVIVVATFRSK